MIEFPIVDAHVHLWDPDRLTYPWLADVPTLVFGGDWPVVVLAARLDKWMKTLWAEVEGCSESERRKLFRENAIRCYRLE